MSFERSRRPALPVRLAWLLPTALLMLWAAVAQAAEPAIRIEARSSLGLPEAENANVQKLLLESAAQGAGQAEVAVHDEAPAVLQVELAWSDDRQIDYVGKILLLQGDEQLAIRSFACDMCGTAEAVERMKGEVKLALGSVATWPEPEPADDQDDAGAAAPSPAPVDDDLGGPRTKRIGPLGWTGVATAALGVTSVAVGAVLLTRDDELELREGQPRPVFKTSYRPPGIALVGAGAGVVLVGATLVIIDVVRHDRRAKTALVPALGPSHVGLRLTRSF